MTLSLFAIGLQPESTGAVEGDEPVFKGVIQIDSYSEQFLASASFWGQANYEQHWRDQVERIVAGGFVGCLITSMEDPSAANFLTTWPMYRDGSIVFLQNKLLFLNTVEGLFDPRHPERYIGERITRNEEGDEISEWSTTVQALEAFLHRTGRVET